MIQVSPQMRILLCRHPQDFRKGIDGLARVCRTVLQSDPFSGGVFVFVNKRRTSLKILCYDGQGYWLCQKRFSRGKLRWWPVKEGSPAYPVAAHELQIILWNGHPHTSQVAPQWRKILPIS
jgi:hypothetical protein